MFTSIRNFFAELKASRALGRASKHARQGRKESALEIAKSGITNLRQQLVDPALVAESSAHAVLTMFVERIAKDIGTNGAQKADLEAALSFLQSIPEEKLDDYMRSSIEYLELAVTQTRSRNP